MGKPNYAAQHDRVMVDVHALLERLVEALDKREQRLDGKYAAAHVARIESVRDRLGELVNGIDRE